MTTRVDDDRATYATPASRVAVAPRVVWCNSPSCRCLIAVPRLRRQLESPRLDACAHKQQDSNCVGGFRSCSLILLPALITWCCCTSCTARAGIARPQLASLTKSSSSNSSSSCSPPARLLEAFVQQMHSRTMRALSGELARGLNQPRVALPGNGPRAAVRSRRQAPRHRTCDSQVLLPNASPHNRAGAAAGMQQQAPQRPRVSHHHQCGPHPARVRARGVSRTRRCVCGSAAAGSGYEGI
jgi:hypothetical protein